MEHPALRLASACLGLQKGTATCSTQQPDSPCIPNGSQELEKHIPVGSQLLLRQHTGLLHLPGCSKHLMRCPT